MALPATARLSTNSAHPCAVPPHVHMAKKEGQQLGPRPAALCSFPKFVAAQHNPTSHPPWKPHASGSGRSPRKANRRPHSQATGDQHSECAACMPTHKPAWCSQRTAVHIHPPDGGITPNKGRQNGACQHNYKPVDLPSTPAGHTLSTNLYRPTLHGPTLHASTSGGTNKAAAKDSMGPRKTHPARATATQQPLSATLYAGRAPRHLSST